MRSMMRATACGVVTVALTAGIGAAQGLPVIDGKRIVASVQGEPITVEELAREVAVVRRGRPSGATVGRAEELALLNRMIDLRLIAQEARRMELDKLPELRQAIDAYARVTLRDELVGRVVKDAKADPKEVEAAYRAAVRRWKISAALFEREEPAKNLAAEVAAGKSFGEVAHAALAAGRASKVEDGVVLKREAMDPTLAKAVDGLAVGATSPVVSTPTGFVVLKLEEILYPDDPAARAAVERAALLEARKKALVRFDAALRKKYAKIDRKLLAGLDYEAETPGIEALRKDTRVLAEIRGEPPVTVGELSEQLKYQFFHGANTASARKKLNARKEQILEAIIHRRAFRKEALRLGLERTDDYTGKVDDYERSILFGAVLRKVIAPDLALKGDEVKAYYDAHRAEYATPRMIRLKSLVFVTRARAEAAVESLRTGADFQWVASRAEGQVDPGAKGVLIFDGRPIIIGELPEGVRTAVAGTKAGDVRLYESPDKRYYALAVQDVVASQTRPLDQVRKEIGEKVLDVKIKEAVEEYARKLRSLSDVKVYLKAS